MPHKTKSPKGKKGIKDRRSQEPAEKVVKEKTIVVRLPNCPRVVLRPLKNLAPPASNESKAASTAPVLRVQKVPVRLPPKGPEQRPLKESSKFLNLPGEIRNKIYGYLFKNEFFEIRFADRGEKSLTYRLPNRPTCMQPKLEPNASRRRRLYDWPRRIYTKEVVPVFHLSPGPAALLLTAKQINEEATPLFYRSSTFTFQNLRAFDRFLTTLSVRAKSSIRSLHLSHHTAGNAFHTPFQPWTRLFDRKWDDLCWKASEELTALEELSVDLMINEVPISFDPSDTWMMALLSFEAIELKRCSIILRNHATPRAVLEVEAYKLRRMLLAEAFVEGWRSEAAWKKRRMIPKAGARILRLVM